MEGKKPLPPPPINLLTGNTERTYNDVAKTLNRANVKSRVTLLAGGIYKINVENGEEYKRLRDQITEDGWEYFTYEDKNIRPIKVMARGIYPECQPEEIVEFLKARQFAIQDATNIQRKERDEERIIKRNLPLFMLTFDRKQNIEEIYKIDNILGLRVRIEPLRKRSTLIPQCKKCQMHGHTQKYCNRQARCVKCAGKHLTSNCNKKSNEQAKCANCGEAHPASYRGCSVAKELQKMRDDALRKQKINTRSLSTPIADIQTEKGKNEQIALKPKKTELKQVTLEKLYATALKDKKPEQKEGKEAEPVTTNQMLQKILAELEEQKKTNKMILTRISKLESKNIKVANKKK